MTDDRPQPTDVISSLERAGLSLVFGGPLWLWQAMARIVGVRVEAQAVVDEALLVRAEAGARTSARWFAAGLPATLICLGAMAAWSPTQASIMRRVMHVEFHAVAEGALANGHSWFLALALASAMLMVTGLAVGIINASVFGGIPMYLLRCSTVAAAPAVSVALAHKAGVLAEGSLAGYPRVALAVERVLTTRRRSPRRARDAYE